MLIITDTSPIVVIVSFIFMWLLHFYKMSIIGDVIDVIFSIFMQIIISIFIHFFFPRPIILV